MARLLFFVGLIANAVCFSCLLGSAHGQHTVKGNVHCDPCRVESETSLTKPMKGVSVKLQCKSRVNNRTSFSAETETDDAGTYSFSVNDDHEDEICEVILGDSPDAECSDKVKEGDRARVSITKNAGDVIEPENALTFKGSKGHGDCPKILQEMGYLPQS